MQLLAKFEQSKVLTSLSSLPPEARYGCCLAFCVEWVRLALYKYQAPLETDATSRMALLTSEASTIAAYQSTNNYYNSTYGKTRDYDDPNPNAMLPAKIKHQPRQCYIFNSLGQKTDVLKDIKALLQAESGSFTAQRYFATKPDEWSTFGQELMAPDSYHLILLKRKDSTNKWHHAIASWAYLDNGNHVGHVFDPNHGEMKIAGAELADTVLDAVKRCESGAPLHSLRYIRIEKGAGQTGGVDF
jgi:hypothetical protein